MNKKIIFRADGNNEIGLGHITRSLALAEMLKYDFNCVFATREPVLVIMEQILNICKEVIELPAGDEHFSTFLEFLDGDEIVVLDNYYFDTEYQKSIKNKGCKLVCIDDLHDKHFVSDIVINHSPGVSVDDYSCESNAKLLLGTKYLLLRAAFLDEADKTEKNYTGNNAFICFGGSDIHNLTLKFLKQLQKFTFLETINIVLGANYLHEEELDNFLKEGMEVRTSIFKNLSGIQMLEVMKNSDFAVVPSSSILFEVMAAKLPVITGFYVDNQKNISDYFKDKGVGVVKGNFNNSVVSLKDVQMLSSDNIKNIKMIVDGRSGQRLLNEFLKLR